MASNIFNIQTHVIPCQYIREYPGATSKDQEDTLHLHVKQYTPQDASNIQPGAITIIGAHANGFPKELYEPLWDELYLRLKGAGLSIRSIWVADVAHQGMSSVLNEDYLGNDPSWNDHARDLLHMVNYFRKEMHRPLVGIGHSMGGCQLVNLSIIHPRLLSTLVLIDPVIQPETLAALHSSIKITQLSTFRRDIWPSRAEAAASFRKNQLYQTWDSRVLNLWIEHGLRELPTVIYPESPYLDLSKTPVTLKTTKHQEVFTFLRPKFDSEDSDDAPADNSRTYPETRRLSPYLFNRPEPASTFRNLPYLHPCVLYIFGGRSQMSPPEARNRIVETTGIATGGSGGVRASRVREIIFDDIGHLVPMDAVNDCAQAAAEWLVPEVHRWREEEVRFQKAWDRMEKRERAMVSEEWKMQIGGDPKWKTPKL